jgi:DNA-binding NarL/FixJ family response regulator
VLNDLSDKQIATALSIASVTVRQHYNNAYLKLMPQRSLGTDKTRARSGLILFVVREGLKGEVKS